MISGGQLLLALDVLDFAKRGCKPPLVNGGSVSREATEKLLRDRFPHLIANATFEFNMEEEPFLRLIHRMIATSDGAATARFNLTMILSTCFQGMYRTASRNQGGQRLEYYRRLREFFLPFACEELTEADFR